MKLKKMTALFLALVLTVGLMAGCGAKEEPKEAEPAAPVTETVPEEAPAAPEQEAEAPAEAPAQEEAPAAELEIKNAKNFAIEYMENDVKLVTDSEGNQLLLVPREAEAPAGYEDIPVVVTPITSAMYTSTVQVGYLGALENDMAWDSITAVCTKEDEWTTPEVLERFANGQITYVEQDHWNAGDIETITNLRPEIVFTGGGDESGVQLRGMLDEVGIKYAVVNDWLEADSMSSLEWIKFFGAFFNLDEEAAEIYEAKLARMDELYAQMADVPDEDRPVVAYGSVFEGIVYTSGGDSTLAEEIEKAGATYAMADVAGDSLQMGMEEFLSLCKDADILIYSSLPQYTPDTDYIIELEPLFAEFKAYQNNQIYGLDMGYYMNAAKVVEKFEDLVAMCHPEMMEGHVFTMYQLLPKSADAAE